MALIVAGGRGGSVGQGPVRPAVVVLLAEPVLSTPVA
jgi:hypothetical protein